ncbi:MAG: GIY-YIG nuclease family protein [Cetobacterium sp.]|nr:GIY-YIG nuclease family protein [Cetobacterium sp.]
MRNWYIYLLRCKDNSLYTGITTDIERRFKEHREGKGAKYTKAKGVINIKLEYKIKKLTKKYKEILIKYDKSIVDFFL